MNLRISQTKRCITRKVTFGKSDDRRIDWARNAFFADIDNLYVPLDEPAQPEIALGRAFSNHLKMCGLLDGYTGRMFVKGNYKPQFVCKVNLIVSDSTRQYKLRVEMSYVLGKNRVLSFGVDKEKISQWLFDSIVQNEHRSLLFEMRIRHVLELKSIRCFVDEMEIVMY